CLTYLASPLGHPPPHHLPYTTLFRSRCLFLRCRLILAVVASARVVVVVLILGVTVVRLVRVLRCRHDRPLAIGMQSLAICLYPGSGEHTSELQSRFELVCRRLLGKNR